MKKILVLGLCCGLTTAVFAVGSNSTAQVTGMQPGGASLTATATMSSEYHQILALKEAGRPVPGYLYEAVNLQQGVHHDEPVNPGRQGGETIATATVIGALPYSDSGTTVGHLNDYDVACPYTGSTSADVVYSFTPGVDTAADINLCAGNTNYDSKIYVFQDSPATVIACNDDFCSSPVYSSWVSQLSGVLMPAGHTYYIVVDGYGGSNGTYFMDIIPGIVYPAPPNDDCLNAEAVAGPYPQTVTGTTLGATIDCPGVLDWNAVWYAIDLPFAVNDLLIDYCGTATNIQTVGIVYYDDCNDCALYHIADFYQFSDCGNGTTEPQMLFQNLAGPRTIYFPVYVVPAMDFSFTANVSVPNLPPSLAVVDLPDTELAGPWTVTATAADPEGALVGCDLYYAVNGGAGTLVPMTLGPPDTYTGDIPDQPVGSSIAYYVVTTDGFWSVTSPTYGFGVFDYQWPPTNLAASDGLLNQVNVSWSPPVAPLPPGTFFEGFEAGIPGNWTVYNVDGGDAWIQYTADFYEGAACAAVWYDVPNNDWLITPPIQVTATSALDFYAKAGSASWVPELLTVYVSTTDNLIPSFTTMVLDLSISNTAWAQFSASLAAFDGQTVYLGFYCHSYDMWNCLVDNVRVTNTVAALAQVPGARHQTTFDELVSHLNGKMDKAAAVQMAGQMLAEHQAERALQGYNVYRDGLLIGTSATTNYVDVPPVDGQLYTYHVAAQWDAGESGASNTDTGFYLIPPPRPTSGGPDAGGYTWMNSDDPSGQVVYNWVEISATGTNLGIVGDDTYGTVTLSFGFPWYGNTFTTAYVSSNGYVTFQPTATPYWNGAIPDGVTPSDVVYAMWDDLYLDGVTGKVFYLDDVANQRAIFQWEQVVPLGNNLAPHTFEIILYADGRAYVQYRDVTETEVLDSTVGSENIDSTIGLQVNLNDVGGAIEDLLALRITAVMPCDTPTGLVIAMAAGDANLSWNAAAGALSYNILGATDGYGPYALVGVSATTTFTDIGAQIAGRKFYQIVSVCQ